jgi:uncharacterized protein YjbI with pentapeptide repeats
MKDMDRSHVEAAITAAREKSECLDLSRTNLTTANLAGLDLTGANLKGAWLSSANLSGANLSGADLTGANLCFAYLTYAHLADDPMTVTAHEIPEARAWAAQRIADPTALMQLALDDEWMVCTAALENSNCTDEIRVAVTLRQ